MNKESDVRIFSLRTLVPLVLGVSLAGACAVTTDDPNAPQQTAKATQASTQSLDVVTHGQFHNLYVLRDPGFVSWEDVMRSERPEDYDRFSRASIDQFTATLMTPGTWPSYWDALYQYQTAPFPSTPQGISPPTFTGSTVASQACVDAAMQDAVNGVLQWDTIGSLVTCALGTSQPQVNVIVAPEILVAKFSAANVTPGLEMCAQGNPNSGGYHAKKLDGPDFTVVPTSPTCILQSGASPLPFDSFTRAMTHEMAELLSDPGGFGFGGLGSPDIGNDEVGDICNPLGGFTMFAGYSVSQYWSQADGNPVRIENCEPAGPPTGSTAVTWLLPQSRHYFKGGDAASQSYTMLLPESRLITNDVVTQISIVIQTEDDDLDTGTSADVVLNTIRGDLPMLGINNGHQWNIFETNSAIAYLARPSFPDLHVSDLLGVTINAHLGCSDPFQIACTNWNMHRAALVVSTPIPSTKFTNMSLTVTNPTTNVTKCLDILDGLTANNTPLVLWDCVLGTLTQTWSAGSDGTIRPAANMNKCITLSSSKVVSTIDNTKLVISDCVGAANQVWNVTPIGAQAHAGQITGYAGKCVDLPGGTMDNFTGIDYFDCVDGAWNESWRAVAQFPFTNLTLTNPTGVTKCLDISGGDAGAKNNNAALVLGDCVPGALSQLWSASPDGTIRSAANPNKCIDLPRGDRFTPNGTFLDLFDCVAGAPNLGWAMRRTGPTSRVGEIISTLFEGKCMEVPTTEAFANLARVDYRDCNGAWNQSWRDVTQFTKKALTVTDPATHKVKCLDINDRVMADNTPVVAWDCVAGGTPTQTWSAFPDGTIRSGKDSKFCLDLPRGNIANNTGLDIFHCVAGAANLGWYATPGDAPSFSGNIIGLDGKCVDLPQASVTVAGSGGKCAPLPKGKVAGNGVCIDYWDCVSGALNESWTED